MPWLPCNEPNLDGSCHVFKFEPTGYDLCSNGVADGQCTTGSNYNGGDPTKYTVCSADYQKESVKIFKTLSLFLFEALGHAKASIYVNYNNNLQIDF